MSKEIPLVPIEVSARHIHLSQDDLVKLFGDDYELSVLKPLSQLGEFAANSLVDIRTDKNTLRRIRVIGPTREKTQIEISRTDAFFLGIDVPLRVSGDTNDAADIAVIGPKGEIVIKNCVIVAKRHLHCSPIAANEIGLIEGQVVKIEILGERSTMFENVVVRIKNNFRLAVHLDTDEANAGWINDNNNQGRVIID